MLLCSPFPKIYTCHFHLYNSMLFTYVRIIYHIPLIVVRHNFGTHPRTDIVAMSTLEASEAARLPPQHGALVLCAWSCGWQQLLSLGEELASRLEARQA